jgi:hypothetical protein
MSVFTEEQIAVLFPSIAMASQPGLAAMWDTLALCDALHRRGLIDKADMTQIAAAMSSQARDAEALKGKPLDWTIKLREWLERWSAE